MTFSSKFDAYQHCLGVLEEMNNGREPKLPSIEVAISEIISLKMREEEDMNKAANIMTRILNVARDDLSEQDKAVLSALKESLNTSRYQ